MTNSTELDLGKLLHTILSIAEKNGINYWLALAYFKDIETRYNFKLDFESETERLEIKNQMLKDKLDEMFERIKI